MILEDLMTNFIEVPKVTSGFKHYVEDETQLKVRTISKSLKCICK